MYMRNENSLPNGEQYYFSTTHCDSADCKTEVDHGAMPLALSWLALLIYGCCPENLCLGPKRCNGQLVFKHLTFCSHETAGIRHIYYWLVIWFPFSKCGQENGVDIGIVSQTVRNKSRI